MFRTVKAQKKFICPVAHGSKKGKSVCFVNVLSIMNFSVPGTAMAAPSILMSPMSPVLRSIAHLTFSLTALVACILKRSGKIRSLRFFADALDLLTIIKFQGSQPFLEGLALLLSFFVFFHTVSMTDFHQPGGDYFLSVKFFFASSHNS